MGAGLLVCGSRGASCGSRGGGVGSRGGFGSGPGVVGLAAGRAPDFVDEHCEPGRLVSGDPRAQVLANAGVVERGSGLKGNNGGDAFAELLVGYADNKAVADGGMLLQRLLDLLGKDLLAAGVDA